MNIPLYLIITGIAAGIAGIITALTYDMQLVQDKNGKYHWRKSP